MLSRACLAGLVLVFAPGLALAQTPLRGTVPPPPGSSAPAASPQAPQPGPPTLANLYDRLKQAATAEEAEALVRQIARRWARSGSDSADLLLTRARQALGQQNAALAIELLDRVVTLQPSWAEAWHMRGLAFFVLQDDGRALVDFREALRREPRHFMAMGMAAAAFQRQGDERNALAAYRALREMHPHFRGAKEAVDRLMQAVDGRDA
jgi:tetratricopeptide (TPR) repeat protein